MGKKYIVMKAQKMRKLYIDDVLKVHIFERKKTPKVPSYHQHDLTDSEEHPKPTTGLTVPANTLFVQPSQ